MQHHADQASPSLPFQKKLEGSGDLHILKVVISWNAIHGQWVSSQYLQLLHCIKVCVGGLGRNCVEVWKVTKAS